MNREIANMNNQSKRESNPFKDMLLVFFIVGSIVITSLGWIFYGEIAFKIIFSLVLFIAAILSSGRFYEKKEVGPFNRSLIFSDCWTYASCHFLFAR